MVDIVDLPSDNEWLRSSFLLQPKGRENAEVKANRYKTGASDKFFDASLGGNYAINMPPMFTHTADPKIKGIGYPAHSSEGWGGMGRYYSEAIDDNSELLHLRMGVAENNSIAQFALSTYDPAAGRLARTGESSGLLEKIGYGAGYSLGFLLKPISFLMRTVLFGGIPKQNRFYYIKPAMSLYWGAVNNIAGSLAVNIGLFPDDDNIERDDDGNSKAKVKDSAVHSSVAAAYHKLLPEVFLDGGGIDVRAVASRAERLARARHRAILDKLEEAKTPSQYEAVNAMLKEPLNKVVASDASEVRSTEQVLDEWARSSAGRPDPTISVDQRTGEEQDNTYLGRVGHWITGFGKFAEAEAKEGSAWATFRVNGERTFSESFSNSTGEASIASKINSMSASARETKFSLGNGNLGDGIIPETIEKVASVASSAATGVANALNLKGLGALLGGAFVDIPHVWQDSSAESTKIEYTFQLRATYGTKMSIYTDIYIPLAMLLAASLPMATGNTSYTSPFLVEAYRRGRHQCRMGIVDSISINRGVGNNGWSVDGLPTAVDVTISILDLSSRMYMPIERPALLSGWFDGDSAYSDYLATLGGLGLVDQTTFTKKWKRNAAEKLHRLDTTFTRSNFADLLFNRNIPLTGTSLGRITANLTKLGGGTTVTRN